MSRWSRTLLALTVTVGALVLLSGGVNALALGQAGDVSAQQFGPTDHAGGDQTVFLVELDASGDANVSVTYRIPLHTDSDVAGFEEVAESFESGEETIGIRAFENASDAVAETVERTMDRSETNRTATIQGTGANRTGLLQAEFTWENFARSTDSALHLDDVFTTDEGPWLPGLTSNQELVLRAPPGFGITDGSVPAQDGELRWIGPVPSFADGELHATFVGDGPGTGNGSNDDPDNGSQDDDTSTGNGGLSLLPLLAGGVVVGAMVLLLLAERTGRIGDLVAGGSTDGREREAADGEGAGAAAESGHPESDGDTNTARGSTAGVPTEGETDGEGRTKAGSEAADETAAPGASVDQTADSGVAAEDTAGAEGSAVAGPAAIDDELLSDEERIDRLLEENGGRMKQADIVEATDWSNAKVSQLLSSMHEAGDIDKLRIGRENLISFPDVDITAGESDDGEGGQ